jgi:hypothetical protein
VALKACTVVVHDLNQIEHAIDVTAESLYEAVAQALAALRGHDWVGDIRKGLTTVTVKVRHPEVTHVLKLQDFENWLNRGCKSPADTALKMRMRQMLGAWANNNKKEDSMRWAGALRREPPDAGDLVNICETAFVCMLPYKCYETS